MKIKIMLETEITEPNDRLINELERLQNATVGMVEMVLTQQGKIHPTDIRVSEIQFEGKSKSGKKGKSKSGKSG